MARLAGPLTGWFVYALAGAALGAVFLLATPFFWRASDRTLPAYLLFAGTGLGLALLLKGPIVSAKGWRVWGMGLLLPVLGCMAVMVGASILHQLDDALKGHPFEGWGEALGKTFLVMPAIGLLGAGFLVPLYLPLGFGAAFLLRYVGRRFGTG